MRPYNNPGDPGNPGQRPTRLTPGWISGLAVGFERAHVVCGVLFGDGLYASPNGTKTNTAANALTSPRPTNAGKATKPPAVPSATPTPLPSATVTPSSTPSTAPVPPTRHLTTRYVSAGYVSAAVAFTQTEAVQPATGPHKPTAKPTTRKPSPAADPRAEAAERLRRAVKPVGPQICAVTVTRCR